MSKHLAARNLELYYRRALPAQELIEADAHLSSCAACREQLKDRENTESAIKELRLGLRLEETVEPAHPSYEQFAAYAEERLDEVEREILDSHLLICAQCDEIMRDLRGFVAAQAPARLPEQSVARPASFGERFISFWRAHTQWMSLQFAGAAAALLLLVGIGAILWLSFRRAPEQYERARISPTPTESPQTPPINAATPVQTPTPSERIATDNRNRNLNVREEPRERQLGTANSASTSERPTLIALRDGASLVTVDDRGNVNGLDSLTAEERQAVKQALTKQRAETPTALASLIGSVAVLRGETREGVSFKILSPVGTVVMTDRPTLRWGELEGATSYVVRVFDRNFRKVAESQPQSGTQWTTVSSLARGGVYTWQVTAIRNGEEITSPVAPAPEAKFMVLSESQAEELNRARKLYASSHLTLGTLYARAGLLDEAEREFQMLLRDNPKSAVARKLLESVRTLRDLR